MHSMLRLERVGTLDDVLTQDAADQILILVIALVTLSVVLLSAAGIYALMSCTISLRHREIGIRSALGARPQERWSYRATRHLELLRGTQGAGRERVGKRQAVGR